MQDPEKQRQRRLQRGRHRHRRGRQADRDRRGRLRSRRRPRPRRRPTTPPSRATSGSSPTTGSAASRWGRCLPLGGSDPSPLSLAAADFDGDGALDLAAAAFFGDRLHVYRNRWRDLRGARAPSPLLQRCSSSRRPTSTSTASPTSRPSRAGSWPCAARARSTSSRRRPGSPASSPRRRPSATSTATAARTSAVVNEGSDDVSLLLSTACAARRLECRRSQPLACGRPATLRPRRGGEGDRRRRQPGDLRHGHGRARRSCRAPARPGPVLGRTSRPASRSWRRRVVHGGELH